MRLVTKKQGEYLDKIEESGATTPVTLAQLNAKLTASKAAAQANSTATDVPGLVTDFNALIAKLKAAGIMS